jgi:hypothetical protein
MRIDSSGNCGIGTSSPLAKFVVSNGTEGIEFGYSAGLTANYLQSISRPSAAGVDMAYFLTGTGAHRFYTGGTESMRIDASGNCGIGISSPTSKLDINSSSTANDYRVLNVYNSAATGTSAIANVLLRVASYGNGAGVSINLTDSVANNAWISMASGNLFFSNASGNERMRIDASGNCGIGTSSPTLARLQVSQTSNTSGAIYAASASGQNGNAFAFQITGVSNGYQITNDGSNNIQHIWSGTTGAERMRITAGGEVYIAGTTDQGAFNLQCNGTGVWGAGAYTNGSDARIKEDVTPIDSGLDVVQKLNPVTYKYKEDWSKDQSTQTGFIAQELLVALEGKNYVDGVVTQGGEYMSVAYQNIIPILTKAIQEQQALINNLTTRLNALEGK